LLDYSNEYEIVRTNCKKTVRFVIKDNTIIVYCPKFIDKNCLNNFYLKYRTKLLDKLNKIKTIEERGVVKLFGIEFSSVENYSKLLKKPSFEIKNGIFIKYIPNNCDKETTEKYLKKWKIDKIRKIIYHKALYFNKKFNFKFDEKKNSIKIKEQRSLWGSCSYRNNLNFNYKIIEKSNKVIDYLVLHELNHTIYKDHSIFFWDNLKKICKDCLKLKKELEE
jgi:predicted metal-dependent hydrolase